MSHGPLPSRTCMDVACVFSSLTGRGSWRVQGGCPNDGDPGGHQLSTLPRWRGVFLELSESEPVGTVLQQPPHAGGAFPLPCARSLGSS